MMKIITSYFCFFLILACSSANKDSSVFLFNDKAFRLLDGEKVVTIDSKNEEIYNSYFDKKVVQIPLFKCVKTESYTVFIGIPFNTSVKELADLSLKKTLNQTFFKGDSTNYFYKTYSDKDEYITVYTKSFDNNLVYVLTVSNSAKISDSLFNQKTLSNRFN
jgi:hypothetical protein